MSIQSMIDRIKVGDFGDAEGSEDASSSGTVARAARADFGDRVAAVFAREFPRNGGAGDAATATATPGVERFKPGANPDHGDRVAAAFDRLFPPKGAIS
jgi:hypothetical protein